MSKNLSPFPWHYYIKTVRSRVLFIILTAFITFITAKLYPDDLLIKIFIIIIILTLLAFIQAIFRIQPFMKLLGRIEQIRVKLPHNKKLDFIYQKNEWKLISEMILLTEKYLIEQDETLKNQSIQSDILIESIPNEMIIIDNFQNCKRYNTQFKQKFIADKETTLVEDEKLWRIFENQKILNAFTEAIQSNQCIKIPGLYFPELGEYFDIAITAIQDSKKEIIGALGIFHNVTASKLSEKMRVDFVANVSHEIRTPLTSIKGYSQLLSTQIQNLPGECDLIVDKIVSNTERLKDLFDNLLKLSTIESQHDLELVDIDFENLITRVESALSGKYMNKPFKIEREITTQSVTGDAKLLEQVITNLVENAIKYGPEKPVIKITTQQDSSHVIITINDNGPGIKEEDIQRIFERFYRVQGQTSSAIEGTGLGLSIVKHIVNKHRGEISVHSHLGTGTTFEIKLPGNKHA